MRSVELPGGMARIADGDPSMTDEIDVVGEAFDFGGLEIERVLRNQDQGVGATLHFDGAMDVRKNAVAGADVVVGFIGFKMLVVVIEADVAASDGFGGLLVVFDMVGLEALVAVMNVDVIVGNKEVAALLLGATGPDFDIAGFGGVQGGLLRKGNMKRRAAERIKKRCEEEKEAERGGSPGMGVTDQTEHLGDENSGIA